MNVARTSPHPRVSVSSISSMNQSFDDDLALWEDLGMVHVGLISPKLDAIGWEAGRQAVLDRGLRVSSISCLWDGIADSLEFAPTIGCDLLYMVSGGGGTVPWEEAAGKFCEYIAPYVARAKELGVRLAVEPTNPLRCDTSFVHSVRDAIDLARMADLGVTVDFSSAWYERGLERLVRENLDLVALVQIGDYKLGTFDMPNRCAVGDGDIPIERIVGMVLDAGYEGVFDIEILGPEIEAEGYRASLARSIERTSDMLDRLGA